MHHIPIINITLYIAAEITPVHYMMRVIAEPFKVG